MRIKFLAVIVSFLFVSIAISSCLDSDESTIELSSDATVHAFGLDTIYGKHYTFTIDQLNRIIYNYDSLPVGADTIIDRILIDTFSVSGWITAGINDTLLNINDSVDLTSAVNNDGMKFKVHAQDGTLREYTLKINKHKEDPDLLVWNQKGVFSESSVSQSQKSVILNDELFVYTSATIAYKTSINANTYGWSEINIDGLPAETDLPSIINFQGKLYAVADGDIYSSADGQVWEMTPNTPDDGEFVALLASFPSNLAGIWRDKDGKQHFCTAVIKEGSDEIIWTIESNEIIPDNFPTHNIYSSIFTTTNGSDEAILVGLPETTKGQTVPWFSFDGKNWADLGTISDAFCPTMANPFIMNYGGTFYIMGSKDRNKLDVIYSSVAGIAWYKTEKKFLLPEEFNDLTAPYSITIDKDNYIWVIFSGGGEKNAVWRGRLNRLGFEIQ